RAMLPLAAMGATMGATLAALAWPLLCRVMTTSYADIYSAFRGERSLQGNLLVILHSLGGAFLLYILLGFVGLLGWRGTRRVSLFLAVQSLLIVYPFSSVQCLGLHHIYLFMPGFLLLAGVFAVKVAGRLERGWLRVAWL